MNTTYRASRWQLLFGSLLLLLVVSSIRADDSDHSYGPRIITIDYEELFRQDTPPSYDPFPMYGSFLFGVANQTLPMVYDTRMALPTDIEKVTDVIYKEIDGIALA
ncbi:MAG: hypothetical protein WBN07_09160, partial [Woeseiaceae bacterium]